MVVCSAAKCSNSSRLKQMRFFKFPSEEARRITWLTNSGLEYEPGPFAKLCEIHFEENQFELHRQDGWKKLKPNAIPTVFPEPAEAVKIKREKSPRKHKNSEESEAPAKKRRVSKKSQETPAKKKKLHKKNSKSKSRVPKRKSATSENCHDDESVKTKQGSSDSTSNFQKENVSPKLRKSRSPRRAIIPESDSSTEEEYDFKEEIEESEDDEAQQQIALLKRENESMKQEISEFEKHNKAMARVILELEKHNKLMSLKLTELDKDNKVLTKKISDLERLNEDLKSKLNCSFSEEQYARMEKMRQLGTIERYIPALK